MNIRTTNLIVFACVIGMAASVFGQASWTGGGADDLWSTGANWSTGAAPSDAMNRGTNDIHVAHNRVNNSTILIDSTVNANAFAVQIGHEMPGTLGPNSATNTLNVTGGSLTTQGNFLFNVGRGRNADPNQLVQFNVSGGVVNAAGITIPEAFDPNNVLGFTSVGINAEMHVSGNAVVNTDLLRLGARDSNSTLTISGNGVVNLNDNNNGFANGQLWLESFEFPVTDANGAYISNPDLSGVIGTSVLDICDSGTLNIEGGVNNVQTDQAMSLAVINDTLIPQGWITACGGAATIDASLANGVITLTAVPEPSAWALLLCVVPFALRMRRKK